MNDPAFDLSMMQAAEAAHLAIDDAACNEGLTNTVAWGMVAFERLVAGGTPAIHASSLIIAVMHTNLMAKLLEPPESEGPDERP